MKKDEITTRRTFETAVRSVLPQATIEWPDSDDPLKAVVTVRLPAVGA
jgi:hypothetical protein